jgi:peptidoglycan/xylan/chitin deacetylase (PgdA/CDA1 family)
MNKGRNLKLGRGLALAALLICGAGFGHPLQGAQPEIIRAGEPAGPAVAITFDDAPSPS